MTSLKELLRTVFVSSIIVISLIYALISMLQSADFATIKIAKDVDAYIVD
jgi:hypothetical protein